MQTHSYIRCLSLLLLTPIATFAGTHNWNGLGATYNWSTAANWTSGVPPVAREASPVVLVFPAGGFQPANICNIPGMGVDSIVINGSGYGLATPFPVAVPLTLRGNGNSLYSAGLNNNVYCPLVLASPGLNFGTPTGGELLIYGAMSGTGGFNKVGQGDVFIEGIQDNTYTGATTVLGGTLHLAKTGGHIAVGGALIIGDTNGSSVGNFGVDSTVILDGDQQILFGAAVTVNPDGLLDMHGHTMAIGSLSMVGNSKIDDFTGTNPVLTLLGDVASSNPTNVGFTPSIHCALSLGGATRTFTIAGVQHPLALSRNVSGGGGNAGIIKNGQGELYLYGVNTYTGDTLVNGGELFVFGTQAASNVFLKPGTTLSGMGSTGAVHSEGATIVPEIYHTSGQPAIHLRTKDLVMDAVSTLKVKIDEDYLFDSALLSVTGTVNLGGCQLSAELNVSGSFSPAVGTSFVIIQNNFADPVIGTFAGLAEGAQFKFGGRLWKITYHGGDGNDVMLTLMSLQLPLSLDSITLDPINHYVILRGNGAPNINYLIQTSPDMKLWTSHGGIQNTNGNLTAFESSSQPARFFRFIQP